MDESPNLSRQNDAAFVASSDNVGISGDGTPLSSEENAATSENKLGEIAHDELFPHEEIEDIIDAPEVVKLSSNALRQAEFERLFRQWRESGDPRLRERLILMNRGLVAYLARRFSERSEVSEDLMQQGLIGLINALDTFDIERGTRFVTYATPTVLGEMRRYLRDRHWSVRVPRRLHELQGIINNCIESLSQQFSRSPTYLEIARSLNLEVEEVIETLELANSAEPVSIDDLQASADGESSSSLGDYLGVLDNGLESLGDYSKLHAALNNLEPRERQVLELLYFQGHTQAVAAQQMKVSQMNISRLQRRALAHLRELMEGCEP